MMGNRWSTGLGVVIKTTPGISKQPINPLPKMQPAPRLGCPLKEAIRLTISSAAEPPMARIDAPATSPEISKCAQRRSKREIRTLDATPKIHNEARKAGPVKKTALSPNLKISQFISKVIGIWKSNASKHLSLLSFEKVTSGFLFD